MKRFYLAAATLAVAAAALASPRAHAFKEYCEDPGFVMRAKAPLPEEDLAALLNKEERADPRSFFRLFAKEGPYGHNELGFRYLARAFGYPGKDFERHAVERWLAEREYHDPEFKGTWELWVKWVREPRVVLRSHEKPGSARLASYFREPLDAMSYGGCVSADIARMRCENFLGKKLRAGARVYYAQNESNRQPCRIHFNGGDLSEEVPAKVEVPVAQYYKVNSRGKDNSIVKVEGTKAFHFDDSFTGKDGQGGGSGGTQPAK